MSIVRGLKWLARLPFPYSNPNADARRMSEAEYSKYFLENDSAPKMLRLALDIRKFEIELYWKRASYFWTLIGAAFAGFAAVSVADKIPATERQDMQVFLSCIGFVLSFGWCCVNKGSKMWQENWENHVDLLENIVHGCLYKVVLRRPRVSAEFSRKYLVELFTGPSEYSVSRINQLISVFVVFVWGYLSWNSLKLFQQGMEISVRYTILVVISVLACISFNQLGRTSLGTHTPEAYMRETKIKDVDKE